MESQDGDPRPPGKWCEPLLEIAKSSKDGSVESIGHYGPEVTTKVLMAAQDWVTKFTVSLGVIDTGGGVERFRNSLLGSGVAVRFQGHRHGVLTAGHVLNREGHTPLAVGTTVVFPSMKRDQLLRDGSINLTPRPCTAFGFDNESEEGPDIAILPLTDREWSAFDRAGMVAYNLDKERWSASDKKRIGAMNPCFLSVISGMRNSASQIVQDYRDEDTKSIVVTTSDTTVNVAAERDGFDYLELPSQATKFSHPTRWRSEMPIEASEKVEKLVHERVTPDVWSGISGAGVWNLAIGTDKESMPNGEAIGELAGICFYASPEKGCIIAHGTKSIGKIAATHA